MKRKIEKKGKKKKLVKENDENNKITNKKKIE